MRPTARAHTDRGMSLMIATGFVAVVTLSVTLSLRMLKAEAETQGEDRRARQAFFAAEAGLAEGREAARLLLGNAPTFSNSFTTLGSRYAAGSGIGGYVKESADGFPSAAGNEWYEVLPWTNYTLSTGAGAALDNSITTADREMIDQNGATFLSFPSQVGTRYRVFMRDDIDGDNNRTIDANGRVWIVSVGEVNSPQGGLPVRSVVQVLVAAGNQNLVVSGYVEKGGGAEKNFNNNIDSQTPDLTNAPSIL